MFSFLVRRLLVLVPTLLVVSFIVFAMGHLTPGDPAIILAGEKASDERLNQIRQLYGLDQPFLVQYGKFLQGAAKGTFGRSYMYPERMAGDMTQRGFWVSLRIGALAALLATVLGVLLGVVAAAYRGRLLDHLSMFFAVATVSTPNFIFALTFMYVFGAWLQWLPAIGWGQPIHYVLPVSVLGIRACAFIARLTRSAMLDALSQDYVRTAWAKGVTRGVIWWNHALRNALVPVITVLGITFGDLIMGAYIIETIFSIPGLGQITIHAIFQRDYPVVQATTLLMATIFVAVNLIVDLLYAFVDPRIKYS